MSWQDALVPMLRGLTGDFSDPPKFDDSRLTLAVVMGGLLSSQEYDFSTAYTFDLETPGISPDPVEIGDATAMALFTLKAACIMSTNAYQGAIGKVVRVKEGDSQVDVGGNLTGYKDIMLNGPCKSYSELLKRAQIRLASGLGRAVTGPYSVGIYGSYAGIWSPNRFFDYYCSW